MPHNTPPLVTLNNTVCCGNLQVSGMDYLLGLKVGVHRRFHHQKAPALSKRSPLEGAQCAKTNKNSFPQAITHWTLESAMQCQEPCNTKHPRTSIIDTHIQYMFLQLEMYVFNMSLSTSTYVFFHTLLFTIISLASALLSLFLAVMSFLLWVYVYTYFHSKADSDI